MILQGPPPMPPEVVFQGGPPPEAMMVAIALAAIVAGTIILLPLVRAFARRLSGVDRARMEELEGRVSELEHERLESGDWRGVHQELVDVQERLDFAERLLARAPMPKADLPGGETGESQPGLGTPR